MKRFQFELYLTVDAESEDDAYDKAKNAMQNLQEMIGHSPFSCILDMSEDEPLEVEFDEDQ